MQRKNYNYNYDQHPYQYEGYYQGAPRDRKDYYGGWENVPSNWKYDSKENYGPDYYQDQECQFSVTKNKQSHPQYYDYYEQYRRAEADRYYQDSYYQEEYYYRPKKASHHHSRQASHQYYQRSKQHQPGLYHQQRKVFYEPKENYRKLQKPYYGYGLREDEMLAELQRSEEDSWEEEQSMEKQEEEFEAKNLQKLQQIEYVKSNSSKEEINFKKEQEQKIVIVDKDLPQNVDKYNPESFYIIRESDPQFSEKLQKFACQFKSEYKFECFIGAGEHAMVNKFTRLSDHFPVAIKTFFKDPYQGDGIDPGFVREGVFLRMMQKNRYFMKCFRFMQTINQQTHLVYQCYPHSLDKIIASQMQRSFPLQRLQRFMKELLLGLKGLHEKKIAHRNLNPKSIFIDKRGEIKIGDLSCATYCQFKEKNAAVAGTPGYIAPELLLNQSQNELACDMWAVGCIMGELFRLSPIFDTSRAADSVSQLDNIFGTLGLPKLEKCPDGLKENIQSFISSYSSLVAFRNNVPLLFKHVKCEPAVDLIKRLLCLNPAERITAEEALKHPFFEYTGHLLKENRQVNLDCILEQIQTQKIQKEKEKYSSEEQKASLDQAADSHHLEETREVKIEHEMRQEETLNYVGIDATVEIEEKYDNSNEGALEEAQLTQEKANKSHEEAKDEKDSSLVKVETQEREKEANQEHIQEVTPMAGNMNISLCETTVPIHDQTQFNPCEKEKVTPELIKASQDANEKEQKPAQSQDRETMSIDHVPPQLIAQPVAREEEKEDPVDIFKVFEEVTVVEHIFGEEPHFQAFNKEVERLEKLHIQKAQKITMLDSKYTKLKYKREELIQLYRKVKEQQALWVKTTQEKKEALEAEITALKNQLQLEKGPIKPYQRK